MGESHSRGRHQGGVDRGKPQRASTSQARMLPAARAGQLHENPVADLMSMGIIGFVEVIDVVEHQTHRRPVPARPRHFDRRRLIEFQPIELAGQRIGGRPKPQVLRQIPRLDTIFHLNAVVEPPFPLPNR